MLDSYDPNAELPSEFKSALERLQRLFAGALWDAKFNSCGSAWSKIRREKTAKRKIEAFQEKARQWREESVKAIREWLPKFVDLADSYPEAIEGHHLYWAKERVWEVVEAQCELRRPREGEPLTNDRITRTMVYWFAVASEGNREANLLPLRPWKAPQWLSRSSEEQDCLLRECGTGLWLRLNHVIDEATDLAQVQRMANRKFEGRNLWETRKEIAESVSPDANTWRCFRSEFKALANEELILDPGNRGDRWLRAYVDYKQQESDCGTWHISSGSNEDFRTSFETLATRAGVTLGLSRRSNPLDFWLHSLFLDLLRHGSNQLFAAKENEGGIILRACEASATYCARLEKQALENPARKPSKRQPESADVAPHTKLADCTKFPTMTVQEVMNVVGISRASVYRYLNEGRLARPGLNRKPGKKSKALVLTSSVQKMLNPSED